MRGHVERCERHAVDGAQDEAAECANRQVRQLGEPDGDDRGEQQAPVESQLSAAGFAVEHAARGQAPRGQAYRADDHERQGRGRQGQLVADIGHREDQAGRDRDQPAAAGRVIGPVIGPAAERASARSKSSRRTSTGTTVPA